MRIISNECLCIGHKSRFFNMVWLSICNWIFSCFGSNVIILSPMSVATVCRVGDPLQLTCTASVDFLEWNMGVINEHGRLHEITAFSNSRDMNQQLPPMVVNDTSFTFMRISIQFASPLVSILSINSTSIGLNGTVVNCSDVANPMISASTTIQIIDTSQNLQYTPTLNISEEQYDADNVTVTVKWAQQVGITYAIEVSPWVPLIYNGSTSLQLTILYNTDFNLTVEAIAPCRDNNITVSIRLKYANCGRPELSSKFNCGYSRAVPKVLSMSNDDLPIEGSTVTFSCPRGLVLNGSYSSICTRNGEWEPDPSGLICEDTPICSYPFSGTDIGSAILVIGYLDPATEGATITFQCPREYTLIGSNTTTCMGDGEWEPDPREVECREIQKPLMEKSTCLQMGVPVYIIAVVSSISTVVILLLSVTFFIVGFACGHYRGKGKCYYSSQTDNLRNVPVYEDVLRVPRVCDEAHQKQGFKLRENVAYLSSKSMITDVNQ